MKWLFYIYTLYIHTLQSHATDFTTHARVCNLLPLSTTIKSNGGHRDCPACLHHALVIVVFYRTKENFLQLSWLEEIVYNCQHKLSSGDYWQHAFLIHLLTSKAGGASLVTNWLTSKAGGASLVNINWLTSKAGGASLVNTNWLTSEAGAASLDNVEMTTECCHSTEASCYRRELRRASGSASLMPFLMASYSAECWRSSTAVGHVCSSSSMNSRHCLHTPTNTLHSRSTLTKHVSSFLCQTTTWLCSHLLLNTVLLQLPAADCHCWSISPRPTAATHRMLLQQLIYETDRQTDEHHTITQTSLHTMWTESTNALLQRRVYFSRCFHKHQDPINYSSSWKQHVSFFTYMKITFTAIWQTLGKCT